MKDSTTWLWIVLLLAACGSDAARVRTPSAGGAVAATVAPAVPAGRVAFVDQDGGVALVDLASGAQQRFPVADAVATGLTWSPDGSRIAFVAEAKQSGAQQIMVLELAGASLRAIEHEHVEHVGDLQWDAAGALAYRTYASKRASGENQYFIVPAGSTTGQLVTHAHQRPSDAASVSADGQEVLVRREEATFAVKRDGSGERIVAKGDIRNAAFVKGHAVLYALTKNLAPGNDVPQYVSALELLDGARRIRLADFGNCSGPAVSHAERFVARVCDDGIHVLSLDGGKPLRVIPAFAEARWPTILGFDARDHGIIVAVGPDSASLDEQHELHYLGNDGHDRKLGRAYTLAGANRNASWPAFALDARE